MNSARLLVALFLAGSPAFAADRLLDDPAPEEKSRPQFVFSLLPRAFDPHPHIDYNVITEMTPAGRKLPKPTAEKPAYYAIHPGGELRLGQGATFSDKGPPVEEMQRILQDALQQSHYREATGPAHPPTLLVMFHWGSFTVPSIIDDAGEDTSSDAAAEETEGAEATADTGAASGSGRASHSAVMELIERARLVGGERFAEELIRALNDRGTQNNLQQRQRPVPSGMTPIPNVMGDLGGLFTDPLNPIETFKRAGKNNESLLADTMGSIYFVLASAYDYESVAKNERVLLWRTKMTVNADGVSMSETLLPLITNAGPYLGRDMRSAAVIGRRLDREGTVEIGTPTVIEVIEQAEPAPAPATTPP